jgi:hypothetical protein
MSLRTLLNIILHDERLTQSLQDAEARMLVEWLVERAEATLASGTDEAAARADVLKTSRRARGIARFVALWCHERAFGPALQLASAERFGWPLPTGPMEACDLMDTILAWESRPSQP